MEITYLLKHVELNDRLNTINPWSVRQVGIYQKFSASAQQSTCMFIQPSLDLLRRLREVLQKDGLQRDGLVGHWTALHLLIVGTLTRNWASYVRFLEQEMGKIVSH